MKKTLLLPITLLLAFALILQGCGDSKKSNNDTSSNTSTVATSNTNDKNLGLTAEEFITRYNQALDHMSKNVHPNANYYKIDINKVQNNTILLDGIATLSWHTTDGYIDAVTETVPNPPAEGLNISEAGIIIATTNNQDVIKTITDRIAAHEQKVEYNQNDMYILRLSNFQASQGVRGTSLLVCSTQYRNNMLQAIKTTVEESVTSTGKSTNSSQGDSVYACTKDQHGVGPVDYYILRHGLMEDDSSDSFDVDVKMVSKYGDGQVVHRFTFAYNSQENRWYWKRIDNEKFYLLPDDLIQLVNVCTPFCGVARKHNG